MRPIYKIAENNAVQKSAKVTSPYSDEAKNLFFISEPAKDTKKTSPPKGLNGIRDLINAFEGKTKHASHNGIVFKSRSKSHGNLSKIDAEENDVDGVKVTRKFRETFRTTPSSINDETAKMKEIDGIKQQTIFLQTKIEDCNYTNVTYIQYQNEIVDLLTRIGEIESDGSAVIRREKQKCIRLVQDCNGLLTAKIVAPSEGGNAHENVNEEKFVTKVSALKSIFESNNSSAAHKYVPYKDYVKERKNGTVFDQGEEEEACNGEDNNSDSTIKGENQSITETDGAINGELEDDEEQKYHNEYDNHFDESEELENEGDEEYYNTEQENGKM